jgi:hypothetical protein
MEIVDYLLMLKFPMGVAPAPVFIEPEYRPVFWDGNFRWLVLHGRFFDFFASSGALKLGSRL